MKVYCFTYKGGYGGGCAIVAANSLIEAFGILSSNDEFILDYTDLEHGYEEPLLKADESITEPKVIVKKFYAE